MKKQKKKNRGFTLVEVLICVGIIGIIAAISIPALLSSTSAKALEAQRKALHSRMAQAFAQISNLAVYKNSSVENSAQRLVMGLRSVYKITKACDVAHMAQCGIPDTIYDYYDDTKNPREFKLSTLTSLATLNPNIPIAKWGGQNVSAYGFRTANGESILLFFNPNCRSKKDTTHDIAYSVCVNMIYDLNGRNNAPNAYGEDIGYMTVFYPSNPTLVAPVLHHKKSYTGKFSDMLAMATSENLVPPSIEELVSIIINQNLTQITSDTGSDGINWSATYAETGSEPKAWVASATDGVTTEISGTSAASHRYYLLEK